MLKLLQALADQGLCPEPQNNGVCQLYLNGVGIFGKHGRKIRISYDTTKEEE